MKEVLLAKYGEVALKGLNKGMFETALIKNLSKRLAYAGEFRFSHAQSAIYVEPVSDGCDIDFALELLRHVFGFSALNRAAVCEKEVGAICRTAAAYLGGQLAHVASFRVEGRRSDKKFPLNSMQLAAEVGGYLLGQFPHLHVDLHQPQLTVHVEVRDYGAYVHAGKIEAAGGMPTGTGGRCALMLSGGIDSPVAGYMLAKRGVELVGVHFESPPYTSERAREKALTLGQRVSRYAGDIPIFIVPFADIQLAFRRSCPEELFTILMRRSMVRICEMVARKEHCQAMATGESLAQVASQTMAALVCTDAVAGMPVLRPLIGMDKAEIVEIARRIDTLEVSNLQYEDCCTIFTPKHPRTRPTLEEVERAEALAADLPALEKAAFEQAQVRVVHFFDEF